MTNKTTVVRYVQSKVVIVSRPVKTQTTKGVQGPPGPAGADAVPVDLPDMTLIFENGLV